MKVLPPGCGAGVIGTRREDRRIEFDELGEVTKGILPTKGGPRKLCATASDRLAQLWGLTNGKNVVQTENDCKKLFPEDKWNKLHLQIIFYGREYCQARFCKGIKCPICTHLYPNRKKPVDYSKS